MRFEVGNVVHIVDPSPEVEKWCRSNLVLDNPEFDKKLRMGLWVGSTPEHLYLWERRGGSIVVPFGCINTLMRMFPECSFTNRIKRPRKFNYNSNINLYPYQKKAVEASLEARNGVIVMPCGSGKTQTALEIVSRLGVKTLWLTHTQDLLNQSLARAKSTLNCLLSSYGTITGGKVDIGYGITFATVQTMSKLDLTQYRDEWGCVIVDECHKAIGSPTKVMQFYKVLSNLSCRYKFGITATPKRADKLEKSMFALLGNTIYEVSREDVKETTCPVGVEFVDTGYMPSMDMALSGDGTINYAGLVDDLTHNENRMRIVSDVINKCDPPTLVLANRVDYLRELQDRYAKKSICLSSLGNTKAAKQERKNALGMLDAGEIDCIFATYQLAKEGLDVPHLQYVVFATPEKDETTVMQAAGRVGRKADGKQKGTVIDFVDEFGMLKRWAKKRKNVYAKLGYMY